MILFIVLLVLFILAMALWGAINAGAIAGNPNWFAFVAVLILGIVVFLASSGVIVVQKNAF